MGTRYGELQTSINADLNNSDTSHDQQAETNTCVICLSRITERAVASPCNHLDFDFICLVQWFQSRPTCPLCKTDVVEVQYDFRDTDDFKRYIVPRISDRTSDVRRSQLGQSSGASAQSETDCQSQEDEALAWRRRVYDSALFSLHVGSNAISGYQTYSPVTFATSPSLQAKARLFLRRELRVFDSKLTNSSMASTSTSAGRVRGRRGAAITIDYMIEFVIAVLRAHEPKSFHARAEELVGEFIGLSKAQLLLHELDAWLRSPYRRLEEWDEAVQYPVAP